MKADAPIGRRQRCTQHSGPSASESDRDGAVEALFIAHYDSLRRVALLLLGDGGDAEEVVMEAFVKAMSGWRGFRSVEAPGIYLRRMVINGCRSKNRRRKLEASALRLFHRKEEDPAAWHADVSALSLDVWAAVTRLPMPQRTCVVLRYVDDLPEAEIASIMNVPVGTVKSQLWRARRKLAESLGDEFFGGELT